MERRRDMAETDLSWASCGESTPRDQRNSPRILGASLAWAGSLIGTALLLTLELPGPIAWLVAPIPTVAGIWAFFVYRRFLREADELQRMIQLHALALGFASGWIAICGYPMFERVGAPPAEANAYVVVMAVFYIIGVLVGRRHYR
jgi:hypothetical protein